jgi:hypothetical protein
MVRQRSVCMFWQCLTMMPRLPFGVRLRRRRVIVKETGERVDGFEQQRVDLGLLVSVVLGAVARDEPVPPGPAPAARTLRPAAEPTSGVLA